MLSSVIRLRRPMGPSARGRKKRAPAVREGENSDFSVSNVSFFLLWLLLLRFFLLQRERKKERKRGGLRGGGISDMDFLSFFFLLQHLNNKNQGCTKHLPSTNERERINDAALRKRKEGDQQKQQQFFTADDMNKMKIQINVFY